MVINKRFLLGLVSGLALAASAAWALQTTPTPPVVPETGENSLSQAEIFNVARIKPGFGTASITVSGSAGAATLNNAVGLLSLSAATAGASGTTPTVLTITNSKVGANDLVLCGVDANGVTAGSVPQCFTHITAAGTFTLSIVNASVTAMTSSTMKAFFFVITSGNPN